MFLNTLLKSASLFSPVFSLETAQADKRFLPLALRDFRICRPALVRMRTRKPWRRFRLILLGWYVRFIIDLCSFRKPRAFYFFELLVVNQSNLTPCSVFFVSELWISLSKA